jgi:hypothetical protein
MATKKKTKKKVKPISKERQFLMTLIKYTERCIKNDSEALDEFFIEQSRKLKTRLENTK